MREVTVLGTGCTKCRLLHEAALSAVADMGSDATVEYSSDPARMLAAGIMSSPALLVDGKQVRLRSVRPKDVSEALAAALARDVT